MSRLVLRSVFLAGLIGFAIKTLPAADWPQFRGPGGSGVADDRDYPTTWSATENVAWRIELPGPGASSPITLGERVFVTCYRGYGVNRSTPGELSQLERVLVCLNRADGKVLWESPVKGTPDEDRYQGQIQSHGYATSTPATDGTRVYVFFGKAGVLAFDLNGKQLWQTSVGTGSAQMGWGQGTSLILYKNLVIVPAFAESKAMVALEKETGKQVWKTDADGFGGCWSSPILVDLPVGKQELVVSVPHEIWGLDPNNGDFLWFAEGVKEGVISPMLVSQNGIVYAIGGRQGGAVAIRVGGRDDVTKTHTVWRKDFGSYVTSPVLFGEHLYWVSDRGIAFCVKTADGEQVYRERLADAGQLYSSVVVANGRLFAASRENGTYVYAAKPQFESVARNAVDEDAGTCNATPAFSNGQMFLRTNRYLYCIARK
ncbi:MAG: PQQ-binding-like beta-propeller repeat protein [Schlesneria sp.]